MKPKIKDFDHDNPQPFKYKHIKHDGFCMTVSRRQIMSTSYEDYYPQLLGWHPACEIIAQLPSHVMWGCELYVPGKDHTAVRTAVIACDRSLRLDAFMCFTNPAWDSLEYLEANCPLPFIPFYPGPSTAAEALTLTIPDDQEGWVLKDGNNLRLTKYKRKPTIDLIITDYRMANPGKFSGLIGSIEVGTAEGHVVASASGMSNEMREYLTHMGANMLGLVCEIEYTDVTKDGRLDHPRFKRLRPDKCASECTVSQSPKLERACH